MYICDFSRSVGAGSTTTRKMRGLTRSVIALIVPPLPAPSRPSKRLQTLRPFCTTHCWSLTNSTCRRASSCSYSFRFSLPSAPDSSFLALLFLASVIGSSRHIRFHIRPCPRNCSNVSYVQLRKLPVIVRHAHRILEYLCLEMGTERSEGVAAEFARGIGSSLQGLSQSGLRVVHPRGRRSAGRASSASSGNRIFCRSAMSAHLPPSGAMRH